MKKGFKVTFLTLLFLALCALTALFIGTHDIALLQPAGMIGLKERELMITASSLMLIVVIPVFVLTWVFSWKYRASHGRAKHAPDWEHNTIAECCWWGVPLIIILILAVITWKTSHELDPFRPLTSEKKPIKIQVVALNWKWLFLYPEQGIATVNFIQFPEKTPINFEITSDAPMNSFWIPQLGGQIYAMPAMKTKLHLIADKKGKFRGLSANLSGKGFAGMTFTAQASSDEEFQSWVESVQKSSQGLTLDAYHQLAQVSEYHKPTFYRLQKQDLFEWIIEKYRVPPK